MTQLQESQKKAKLVRKWCLVSTTEAGSGHPTSCLSAADICTVLFDRYFTSDIDHPKNLHNDRLVFSKGHAAPLLYTLYGIAGAYPLEELKTLRRFGSVFEGHPVPKYKYADAATGSLGQGLSVGAGMAWVAKKEKYEGHTYVLLGDGELAEGQVWEAADFAAHEKLDNLVTILDINRLGQSQETMFAHHIEEYAGRFRAFGFEVLPIDGHNYKEIDEALHAVQRPGGKPFVIIAKTYKGHGISFVEDKNGWHGKALDKEQLQKALQELDPVDDSLRFELKKPKKKQLVGNHQLDGTEVDVNLKKDEEYATRVVFGQVLAQLGKKNKSIHVLDGDVMNSTYTEDFREACPERFIEGYIAEQNMVSVAAGLSCMGRVPFVATFASFLSRAADQVRMARISESNIKFVGSHVGVSIGEDGPSQMGLDDIALFGSLPGVVVLQPCDAISTMKLVPQFAAHSGMAYMRTLRPKTPLLYQKEDSFRIGGAHVLRHSDNDQLTIAATGITVFEALKAAEMLQEEHISVRVVDCYSIQPVDAATLRKCLDEAEQRVIITVEDHFAHGGFGDFVAAAVAGSADEVIRMAVRKIPGSGTGQELLADAGIDATHIAGKVRSVLEKQAVSG